MWRPHGAKRGGGAPGGAGGSGGGAGGGSGDGVVSSVGRDGTVTQVRGARLLGSAGRGAPSSPSAPPLLEHPLPGMCATHPPPPDPTPAPRPHPTHQVSADEFEERLEGLVTERVGQLEELRRRLAGEEGGEDEGSDEEGSDEEGSGEDEGEEMDE
jgi:hypothetical protein